MEGIIRAIRRILTPRIKGLLSGNPLLGLQHLLCFCVPLRDGCVVDALELIDVLIYFAKEFVLASVVLVAKSQPPRS